MEDGLRLQTRRELLQSMIPQYREASTIKRKSRLLDAFTAATGYNRKYAMWLLNHAKEEPHSPQRPAPAITDRTSNTRCSWSGTPPTASVPNASSLFFPRLSKRLTRHEHLHLTEECREPTAFHECCDSRSAAAFPAQTRPARPLHDTSRNAAEATHSHPHLRVVEGDPTRLSGSGSRGPLWHRHRGRLPVHANDHRRSNRLDGMPATLASERGAGAGCPPTRTHALPFSDPGN